MRWLAPVTAWFLVVAASYRSPPVLNPTTYRSDDGRFAIEVDPSEPDGSGPGRYRLTRDDTVLWERSHPFTFFDAAVGVDGTAAGISYSRGVAGGGLSGDQGDLRLVVLDPTGSVRFERSLPRRWSNVIHGHPVPQARGVLMDERTRRVLMRWTEDGVGGEEWWSYDLDTGDLQSRFDPRTVDDAHLIDLRRIGAGSGLLAHWESDGVSRFRALSAEFRSEWSFEVTHGPESAASIHSVTESGFLLDVASMGELVDFAVTFESGVTRVRERERRAKVTPPDPLTELEALHLPLLGTIELGGSREEPSPIRNVYDFDIDGRGNFGFARCDADASALVIVDVEGRVLAEVSLDVIDSDTGCGFAAWAGEDAWVVAARSPKGELAKLHVVDVAARRVRPFAAPEGAYLTSLRSLEGRGVSILHGHSNLLRVLDGDGRETARFHRDYNDDRALFSPEDMTALPEDRLAVLDNIRKVIQVFRRDGTHIENIELEKVLGHPASYPAAITASPEGDLAIWDFGSERPFVLLSAGFALVAERAPRYEDERPVGRLRSLRYAPDGSLWAADGAAILRLSPEGVVDRVVGSRPSAVEITEVTEMTRDASGNFYVLDGRSVTVHVFSATGAYSHRCEPLPGDFDGPVDSAVLSVSGDGTVYLSSFEGKDYVLFDSQGTRIATRPKDIDSISEDWYAQPRGTDRWVTTMDDLYLVGADGRVLHRIRRHADRTWLDNPRNAAVASDGKVALLTGKRGSFERGAKVGVFGVDGSAMTVRNFPTLDPFSSIAFEAGRIVLGTGNQLILLDADGAPVGRFVPDVGYDGGYWKHFLTENGRELQLVNRARRIVYRYDLSGAQ